MKGKKKSKIKVLDQKIENKKRKRSKKRIQEIKSDTILSLENKQEQKPNKQSSGFMQNKYELDKNVEILRQEILKRLECSNPDEKLINWLNLVETIRLNINSYHEDCLSFIKINQIDILNKKLDFK